MNVYYLHNYSIYAPIMREVINSNGPVFTPKKQN